MARNGKPIAAKELTHELLVRLYVQERLSTVEIGRRFGVSDECIRKRMRKYGISRRSISEASSGELNSQYTHGKRVGEAEHGYQRKGWNPWNRGKRRESDSDEAAVAEKIRLAMQGHPSLFKLREKWTREDCCIQTAAVAVGMQSREAGLYVAYLQILGGGWTTEHFEESFVFQRPDGLWQGFIVDIAHLDKRVAVEIDGNYHRFPCQIAKDDERDERLRVLGWRVFRVRSEADARDVADLLKTFER